MKTFRLILALAAVALTAVSCVEKSGKYQTLARPTGLAAHRRAKVRSNAGNPQ